MEKRKGKITFSRAGNGLGAKLPLSIPLLKKIGITLEERDVDIYYDEEKQEITVRKSK